MTLVPAALALLWVGLALGLPRLGDFARARRVATATLGVSTLVAGGAALTAMPADATPALVVGSGWPLTQPGFLGIAPVIVAAIGVVAVALSDSISHTLGTLRRILALLAVAVAFVAVRDFRLLALLWALSPLIAGSELRARFGQEAGTRLFALYHGPSIVFLVAAVALNEAGWLAASASALLIAIGLREAVMPGHSWFPCFVERAPLGLVVAFVAPQLGVHAHVQLLGGGLPGEMDRFVAGFGALTAIAAAALGVAQTSARRALAFLLMSQTGLVSLGLQGSSEVARAGALLAWQVLAIATSGFAMTVSALEARRGPLSLATYSGCFARTPRMAAGFMVMGLASVGFPMTLGFVAEDLLVQGVVKGFPALAFVLILATAINGVTIMQAFFRLFSGRRAHAGERDLTPREAWVLSLVLLSLLLGGIAPSWITRRVATASVAHVAAAKHEATAGGVGSARARAGLPPSWRGSVQ